MPYKDPAKRRLNELERSRRYRAKRHAERYGPGAGNQSGRHGNHACGSGSGRWNPNARHLTSHGYITVRVPLNHPHAWGSSRLKRFKYAYEHVVVMTEHLGHPLKAGEVVHHRNGDRTDNRIENLELMSQSEHQRHHSTETRKRDESGRFI